MHRKIIKTMAFSAVFCSLALGNNAYAGRSLGDLGDISMFLANGWALGMTMMEQDYEGTAQYLESMLGAQLTTEIIKTRIIHETRPNGLNNESFPSGHATGAFSAPMFIHKRYGWKQSLIPYGLAIFTGFTRVHTRMHYTHDVLAGAAVSALFTWMFVSPANENIRVWPEFSSNSASVHASVKF
ncbi:MAG: phosphatase PAP2 family protein [Alphaproteobacteria bacterium]|nr:phosphatase PAP2 family protein [Alphaproteobacteria bacterium]